MYSKYKEFERLVMDAAKVLIISHRKPDADALGANCALKFYLSALGKEVVSAAVDKPGKAFDFMPSVGDFVKEFQLPEFDLVVIVDCGAREMVGFDAKYPDFFMSSVPMVNIDHHASNDDFGTLNIVDSKAASATVIIYRMFKYLGVEISNDMATCLLAGIYGDTGSFMHSNVSLEVCEVASELAKSGANISAIVRNIFKTRSVGTLKLWGRVLEKAEVTDKGVVVSKMENSDYEELGVVPEQLSGVVDYLNMVPNTRFAMLLNEDRKGNVKASLRTKSNSIDLSRLAANFGGGGHPKASGFSMPGRMNDFQGNFDIE